MAKLTRTWWGERFLQALQRSMDSGRLTRGRAYASPSRLLKFSIEGTKITSYIEGNQNPYFGVYETPYYDATIQLKTIAPDKWQAILKDISNNAAWLSRLLMNEMPDSIEQAFSARGVHLLPEGNTDLITKCNCPDYANPCKHLAGTYYKVASMLDRDPFLLFQLRGMDKGELQQALAQSPLGQALLDQWQEGQAQKLALQTHRYTQPEMQPSTAAHWQHYWQSEQALPTIDISTAQTVSPAVLIKKGGDYPAFWERDNSFIEAMEGLYATVLSKNKALLR